MQVSFEVAREVEERKKKLRPRMPGTAPANRRIRALTLTDGHIEMSRGLLGIYYLLIDEKITNQQHAQVKKIKKK